MEGRLKYEGTEAGVLWESSLRWEGHWQGPPGLAPCRVEYILWAQCVQQDSAQEPTLTHSQFKKA